MSMTDVSNEIVGDTPDVLRDQAVRRIRKRRDFHTHLFVYCVVNAMVWAVWAFIGQTSGGYGYPWPAWMTVGWGLGVIMNAWDVYLRRPITEDEIRREADRLARGA
jgi:hypothetical protein